MVTLDSQILTLDSQMQASCIFMHRHAFSCTWRQGICIAGGWLDIGGRCMRSNPPTMCYDLASPAPSRCAEI